MSLKTTKRIVSLDVVVLDKKGNPVTGLSRGDFTVLENGEVQELSSFEAITAGIGVDSARTVLVLDELNTDFEDMAYVRYCLEKLLQAQKNSLPPTELVVLNDQGLHVLQPYTRDFDALMTALQHRRPAIPWRLSRGIDFARERIVLSLDSLQMIALSCQGSGSRNNVIWISPGFPIHEHYHASGAYEDAMAAAVRNLSDQMLRARLTVYTIDPTGTPLGRASFLRHPDDHVPQEKRRNGLSFGDVALNSLARQTGGLALFSRNDVDTEVGKAMVEGSTFYTLSYAPADHNFDGGFRKLKVQLKNPDLSARTRQGYYALKDPPAPRMEEAAYQAKQALLTPLRFLGLPVTTTEVSLLRGEPLGRIGIAIDASALQWEQSEDGKLQSNVEIAVGDYSKVGRLLHLTGQPETLTFPIPKSGTISGSVLLSIRTAIEQPPGEIRIVVRDINSGRTGSVEVNEFPSYSSETAHN